MPQLKFSQKYDVPQTQSYYEKHHEGIGCLVSNWREIGIPNSSAMGVSPQVSTTSYLRSNLFADLDCLWVGTFDAPQEGSAGIGRKVRTPQVDIKKQVKSKGLNGMQIFLIAKNWLEVANPFVYA